MSSPTSPVLRQVVAAVRVFLVLSVVLGLAYPLVITGIAQALFPGRADGSLVDSGGRAVGSSLIGQSFTVQAVENGQPATTEDGSAVMTADPAYFQSRPSAAGTGYDPLSSSASNYGPENPALVRLVEERRDSVAAREGVAPAKVPADAVLASGSGLDPQISRAYAELQVPRVAQARGLEVGQVRDLVQQHTDGRALGFLGEPAVNVLALNIALDHLRGAVEGGD